MTIHRFREIMESGLDIAQYYILSFLKQGESLSFLGESARIVSIIITLKRKGFIADDQITKEGLKAIENFPLDVAVKQLVKKDYSYMHKAIESYLQETTHKKNIRNPSGKNLLASKQILNVRLQSFFKKFPEVTEEQCLNAMLTYTSHVIQGKVNFPLALIYFLWNEKRGSVESELLEWLEVEKEEYFEGVNL